MKKFRLSVLLPAMLMLGGCCAGDSQEGTAVLPFPEEIHSMTVTFDVYPSETTRTLSAGETEAVTEWALALEWEQAPLDETKTPDNYAGGTAWHFSMNDGGFTFSYAEYGESAIFIDHAWHAVKNPSNPPVEENAGREVVEFHGRLFNKSDLTEETLAWLAWYHSLSPACRQLHPCRTVFRWRQRND